MSVDNNFNSEADQFSAQERENTTSQKSASKAVIILAVVCGILLIVVGILFARDYQQKKAQPTNGQNSLQSSIDPSQVAAIKGEVDFTALVPEKGEVRILARTHQNGDFMDTGVRMSTVSNETLPFAWTQAVEGENYDIRAAYYINNEPIISSPTVTVTAPANDISLKIALHNDDIKDDLLTPETQSLGGTVVINGYIPDGARVEIYDVTINEKNATVRTLVATIASVAEENKWEWVDTSVERSYELDAVLKDAQGNIIGEADQVVDGELADRKIELKINSKAQPPQISQATPTPTPTPTSQPTPAPTPTPTPQPATPVRGSISGKIVLNGPLAQNSSLLILWRHPGESSYNVAQRIDNPTNSGQTWSWNEAVIGTRYDIAVALQVNESNTSSAQGQIVTAPAKNVNFTLNTNFFVPTPSSAPRLDTCQDHNGDYWNAVLVFPRQEKAGNYWLRVGSSKDDNGNVYDNRFHATNNNQDMRVTVKVRHAQPYYMKYAFSYCVDCTDANNFSPWSQIIEFRCQ